MGVLVSDTRFADGGKTGVRHGWAEVGAMMRDGRMMRSVFRRASCPWHVRMGERRGTPCGRGRPRSSERRRGDYDGGSDRRGRLSYDSKRRRVGKGNLETHTASFPGSFHDLRRRGSG